LHQRLRARLQWFYHVVGGPYWLPHVPLALLLGLGGLWLLDAALGANWRIPVDELLHGKFDLRPKMLPPMLIGGGMVTMALGLLLRSRVAWTMALLLAATAVVSMLLGRLSESRPLLAYFLFVLAALMLTWRRFDRSSVTASTLFALTSVTMLLMYATFGAYYLGNDYKPAITDLATALYYAIVTMSTVGYGDIAPQTPEAKMFAVSVIILGVAVFATSLTAIIGPMVSSSVERIVSRKDKSMKRENHFIVIGNTPLAVNTWRELARRKHRVTRILSEAVDDGELQEADIVVGDPSSVEVLGEAGAARAEAVLAMLEDDSENAFIVLAVKELGGDARTVAAVNDARHLSRVKLVQPDVLIAPQVLGGELIAMLLSGEPVTPAFVMQSVFYHGGEWPPTRDQDS